MAAQKKHEIALYIRLSLEDEKYESMSVTNQKLILRQYAEGLPEYDKSEVTEFVDNGFSGTNFERPAVQKLLDLVRMNKIDILIVKDFTRFGRNSIEVGYFIEQVFPLFRTRFISIDNGFDSANYKEDTGGMEVAFNYLLAEYYSIDLSRKSKSAKYLKMKSGEYQSKLCIYGYRKGKDGRLEIDEETAPVVRMIFSLSHEGNTAMDIIRILHDNGIPTPGEHKLAKGITAHNVAQSHGIWQRSTVLRILENEEYAGTYVVGKWEVKEVGGRACPKDESEWIKIPNHHPAIIDKTFYDEVQERGRHFKSVKKNRFEYPLRGKVFCGNCRHAMHKIFTKIPKFICHHSVVDESYRCHGLTVLEPELEALIFEIISKQTQVILGVCGISPVSGPNIQNGQESELIKQVDTLQRKKRDLYETLIMEELDVNQYKRENARIDTELADLKRLLALSESNSENTRKEMDKRAELRKISEIVTGEGSLTRALVDLLIDRVYVYPENELRIEWKVDDFLQPDTIADVEPR